MKELSELAYQVKKKLRIKFNEKGVKYIEEFIEKSKSQIPGNEREGLIQSLGVFLGQCIIENYGGRWIKDKEGHLAVALDEKNLIYPFAKVYKQFENGKEDSVYYLYKVIPGVFKIEPKRKRKWYAFSGRKRK